jgi:predicted transglutaminase-like cysteine proteinase/thiol-disulfide isomerase/thioredoxin
MRPLAASARFLVSLCLALGLLSGPGRVAGEPAQTVQFVFNDIDGRPVRLADHRGQWVLVAFWAPWCPLCKVQMPALRELDRRPDLTVIGIGLDYDSPDTLRRSAEDHDLGFRVVAGGARRNPNSPHRQVGPVDFFPTSYLYNPAGEIAMYIPGQIRAAKVLAYMESWRAPTVVAGAPAATASRIARTDRLAAFVKSRYGTAGSRAYGSWRAMVEGLAGSAERDRLAPVNDYFNGRIRQSSDTRLWGRQEYWATLGEVLGKGAGDSEDFVIAKYFTLIALGVPAERMRLVYVKPQGRAGADAVHMVLAWFPALGQEPLLLDNRVEAIQPASARPDLRPVFSFNSEGTWSHGQDPSRPEAEGGLPMWEDALRRARNEGFE